jgi:TetR/AcrR family transcriptional repressor of nem operon
MARPREFEMDTALANAMDVFWTFGYEETSLTQLLDGMSLSRGSLYKAFSDKRSLFFAVLNKYDEEAVSPAVKLLSDTKISDGTKRIEILFGRILNGVKQGDRRGCLLCTAAAGSAPHDAEIATQVHRLFDKMRYGFETAIGQSIEFSNQPTKVKSNIVNLLMAQYVGLRVLARSGAPIETLEQVATSISHILTGQLSSDSR